MEPTDFVSFLDLYGARLESYVARFRGAFGLPGHVGDDLRQAAYIGVLRALPYWKDVPGAKSCFNWCAGPMRAEMEKVVRGHYGLRPCGSDAIRDMFSEFEDRGTDGDAWGAEDAMAAHIDLKRILTADKKPAHIVRFIATALSPAAGADIARANGISRQAVCMSVKQTKARLRAAMG